MTFDQAIAHTTETGERVSINENQLVQLFDHDGIMYCFCPDGYSRPIDLEKDIPDEYKGLDWHVTKSGLLDYRSAMVAWDEFNGTVRRLSWENKTLFGDFLKLFYHPTDDDKRAIDWVVVPKNGLRMGEICGRNGCQGIVKITGDGDCACHLYAPCGRCPETSEVECSECDWDGKRDPETY